MRSGVARVSRSSGLSELGAAALHYWEVPSSSNPLVTVASGEATALVDCIGGVVASEQFGSRVTHHNTGGPSNAPYLATPAGTWLRAIISVAADNRLGVYAVCAIPDHASEHIPVYLSGSDEDRFLFGRDTATSKFRSLAAFTGGDQSVVANTAPAFSTGWHLQAFRPLSSGALYQINGSTANADFTGSDTVKAIDRAYIGCPLGSTAGGSVAALLLVNDPTTARDAIVKAHFKARYPALAIV